MKDDKERGEEVVGPLHVGSRQSRKWRMRLMARLEMRRDGMFGGGVASANALSSWLTTTNHASAQSTRVTCLPNYMAEKA